MKLTKSLPVIKERNCNASLVLDRRTQRRNVKEFPLAMRFTIDRKFFYHVVGSSYTEKQFSDICNATKSSSVRLSCPSTRTYSRNSTKAACSPLKWYALQ